MHEVSASMGLSNFDNIDEFITTNFCNFKLYKNELENIPGVRLSLYDDKEKYNYQYIILEIDKSITDITRDQLMKILWAENILVRRYFYPGCHRMEPYRSYFPNAARDRKSIRSSIVVAYRHDHNTGRYKINMPYNTIFIKARLQTKIYNLALIVRKYIMVLVAYNIFAIKYFYP
jgi:hypothetical protein